MLSCMCLGECWDFVALSLEKWAWRPTLSSGTVEVNTVPRGNSLFSQSALMYWKEKSSLLYERLLNTRCLNALYYFCLF